MINLHDMSADFHDAYSQKKLIQPVAIPPGVTAHTHFKQYIYSWMALPYLITELKKQPHDDFDTENDRLERFSVRFVIDKNGYSWFAREGEERISVPTHSQMVDEAEVLTAGNLVFSEDYKQIIEITNKSGHFLPPFKTVVFLLKMLFDLETAHRLSLEIAPEIKLVSYAKSSSFIPELVSELTLSKETLIAALPADVTKQFEYKYSWCAYAKLRTGEGKIESVSENRLKTNEKEKGKNLFPKDNKKVSPSNNRLSIFASSDDDSPPISPKRLYSESESDQETSNSDKKPKASGYQFYSSPSAESRPINESMITPQTTPVR